MKISDLAYEAVGLLDTNVFPHLRMGMGGEVTDNLFQRILCQHGIYTSKSRLPT